MRKQILMSCLMAVLPRLASATTCLDFSGQYTMKDSKGSETFLQANQQDCDRLNLDYDYDHHMMVSRTMILDGVKHVVFSSSELISYETALMTKDGISYQGVDEYIRDKKTYITEGIITLDEHLNLIETTEIKDEHGTLLRSSTQKYWRK